MREQTDPEVQRIISQMFDAIKSSMIRMQGVLEKINAEICNLVRRLPRLSEAELWWYQILKKVRLRLEDEIASRQGLAAATLAALK